MSTSIITFNQILIIFIIIAIGVICYKVKLIDDETNNRLSSILLMLVNPMVIFVSYQREFEKELLEGLLISLLLSVITHVISILISHLLIKKKRRKKGNIANHSINKYVDNEDVEVERMSSIYSNVGFMGIPLMYGIFGTEGVFYATASVTIFNIFLWTHGVVMMSGNNEWSLKSMLKKLLSPSIIAIALGLICFLFQIMIPDVVFDAFQHVANINTPFAMLIAGVTIGKTDFKKLITNYRLYFIAFIKLLLIPVVLLLIYGMLPISNKVFTTAVIMAAAPTATTGILFAIKYKKNAIYSAEIFTVTTLLSAITIPFIVMLAGLFS